jgi:hypothetical protein
MGRAHPSMDTVIELGLTLPDVTESLYYGARALKLHGRMLACTPVNKSAERDSVVIAMAREQRAVLLEKQPSLCYVTDHYAPSPTILLRLSASSRAEVERILRMAWEFVSSERAAPRAGRRTKPK